MNTVLVIMPTYNERSNLEHTARRVREATPGVDLLIVDDGSPDGTGEIADGLAANDPQIHVMHRRGKLGLGTAYLAGFAWGLERGYEVLVEMDADGSHLPEQLPDLLGALGETGEPGPALVLGSRWIPGGRVLNWPQHREILSRGGNSYARLALGIPMRDATGGYRAYRASTLRALDLTEVESHGYCFQIDMAWRVYAAGMEIVEVPITFQERELGESKMSRGIVIEAMSKVTVWGVKQRVRQIRQALGGSPAR